MLAWRRLAWLPLVIAPLACDSGDALEPRPELSRAGDSVSEGDGGIESAPAGAERDRAKSPKIVAFGDSLTAGYGIAQDAAYPARLQEKLDAAGLDFEVINAGVSGETTAGGRRRLSWVLDGHEVHTVVLALGGNDGLRGLPPAEMKRNLQAMIDEARSRDVHVLLCGMIAPPNQGQAYTEEFRAVFHELAEEENVALLPFLLDRVAGEPSLNQSDGIHPNARGAAILADSVFSAIEPLLTGSETSPSS